MIVRKPRTQGRPFGGNLQFTPEQASRLPLKGSARVFAQALGVSMCTIKMWILLEGCPAKRKGDRGWWLLRRKSFLGWLKETGKLSE